MAMTDEIKIGDEKIAFLDIGYSGPMLTAILVGMALGRPLQVRAETARK
jgi:hypothetical protein